ncbi:protein SprT [Vibrio sp. MACH09]|uniref:SprT family zinc-dependent metalloprotease n=1 Tax=Vibrio sp. MACH09 TaxID=3025122 RepID=UPI002794681C|nr:SprT family zinc-dependent metalloprotease [Vibrio sp. MACH09]GLO59876.1 protein SprT [Vibrio sp. MACH09]
MSNIDLYYYANKALIKYIHLAENQLGNKIPVPSVGFKLRGKVAGKAYLQQWHIRLNPVLFRENPLAFINEVIPHELAHLLTFQKFGKVRPHGTEWKAMMEDVLSSPAKTTHSFDISSVQGRTFEYHCQCQMHALTIRRHNKVRTNKASYHCRQCQQLLKFSGIESH